MTKHVMLNNIAHKDLRVITRYGAEFGGNVGSVMTFPTEYGDLQKEYPIFFRKDAATGEFHSVVLLGLSKDENLFLSDNAWNAAYIPGIIFRGPFLIGFQEQDVGGELRREPVIHLDLDDPRVSQTEGVPLFLPKGGNSPYIQRIAAVLRGIQDGLAVSKAMFAAFLAADLIEPVKVEIKLTTDEQFDVVGLHTISEEKLRNLDGATLETLNRAGFLQGAYLVVASLSNVRKLIEMKHRRRQSQADKVS
jgi:hypothetical protein